MNTHEEIEYSKDLAKAKSCIQRNDTKEAEFILNKVMDRSAEWYYLTGLVHMNKGWYDSALQNIETAYNMNPNNSQYGQTLEELNKRTTNYRDSYKSTKNSSNSSCCTGCAEACNCCLSPIVCLGECFSCC